MKRLKHIYFALFLFLAINLSVEAQKVSPLNGFDNLVGGIWLTESEWANGQKFKQEIEFSWGLNQKIVKVKTYGTIDQKSKEYGLRNEGIRAYSTQDSVIQFWEFDIFGGITQGICYFNNKDFHYEYDYKGEVLIESWLFVDVDNYKYQIGNLKDGEIDKVYMESTYRRIKK